MRTPCSLRASDKDSSGFGGDFFSSLFNAASTAGPKNPWLLLVSGQAEMQKSEVPTGGAGQQLAALKQRDLKSAQYEIVGQGRPGTTATDDNDVLHIDKY